MNQLQTFNHELFGELKVTSIENKEMFNLSNVAWSLGYTRESKGIEYLRHDRINSIIKKVDITTIDHGGQLFIDESGLYDFIFEAGTNKARDFRKWITQDVIPSIRKTGSYQVEQPKSQLEVLQGTINELVNQNKRVTELEGQVNNISNIVSINNVGWREKVGVILKKIAKNWTGAEPYRNVINLSYENFEKRAGCKLELRLNNRKERAVSQGMTKSYVKKINKLDVISEEKRLVEIYIQVIKEMAIQFKIDINDFKFEEVI